MLKKGSQKLAVALSAFMQAAASDVLNHDWQLNTGDLFSEELHPSPLLKNLSFCL
jgi:hypothetical protein